MSDRPPLKGPELPADVARIAQGARVVPPEPQEPVVGPIERPHGLSEIVARVPDAEATQPLNLRIPKSLHKSLKVLASLTGFTMTEITIECLKTEVSRRQTKYDRGE
jgi:hypothetical protein